MFPCEIPVACLAAVLAVVMAPVSGNILVISRRLRRRRAEVAVSSVGAGLTDFAAGVSILVRGRAT